METLKRGARGQLVLDLQCALTAAGVFEGDLDGCFGQATQEALVSFQRRRGFPETGAADAATLAALSLRAAPVPASQIPNVTAGLVAPIFPGAHLADITENLPHILNALTEADLANTSFVALALATVRAEASLVLPVSEMQSVLNTSVGGKPFDLYDDRAEMGNKGAPDGANFRGRGFIQLTGRANYLSVGHAIGLGTQLVNNPLLAHDPAIAGKVLANFLKVRQSRLKGALAGENLVEARKIVNGGDSGLQVFSAAYEQCLCVFPARLTVVPVPLVAEADRRDF